MQDIEITFINQSSDHNNYDIVVFQKNLSATQQENAVAWTVLENCVPHQPNTFNIPKAIHVGIGEPQPVADTTTLHATQAGQAWNVLSSKAGDVLTMGSNTGLNNEVEVKNCLAKGAINAQIYKDGKLLATESGVKPEQKAGFKFKPTIWVGVVSQVKEGEVMNSAILSDIDTEIALLGITKANLIMTGGGAGDTAEPFKFTLVPTAY